MKLKISETNAAAIESALAAVNGRSYQHAYTSYGELASVAVRAEKALSTLDLNIGSRSGAVYVSTSGGSVPNSYKGQRNATYVKLARGSKAWFIVGIEQAFLFNDPGKSNLILTAAQDEEIIRKVRNQYSIARSE